MDRKQLAKQLQNNPLVEEIFDEQRLELIARFENASSIETDELVACHVELKGLERLKDFYNEFVDAIVRESESGSAE
jgi:GTP1/Obg family GTP-binding protein